MAGLATINRYAVILQPTEAYLEWTKTCPDADQDMTLGRLQREATVYLIPQTDDDLKKALRRNFKPMLIEELFAWYRDENYWPKDLSFRTFRKFFQVRLASMVFDLGKRALIKEDENG